MSNIAIQVENLSKRYRIGSAKEEVPNTLAASLISTVLRPIKNLKRLRSLSNFNENGDTPSDVIWALKDATFSVEQGEVVGVIGVNGSGKSTLLKILSRITTPTGGQAVIHGRISSLLDIGTGMHPELTGRENIYLNGTILGMRKKEIDRKFDDIVEFAGVERFIDTPVKRYSSGMSVRLAFAVAAHLEPETMMVDEVLAVGDVGFQQKCLAKMGDVAHSGSTILFVSHNMASISTLCDRAMLLNQGRVEQIGPAREIVNEYLGKFNQDLGLRQEWSFQDAPSAKDIRFKSISITDHTGSQSRYFPPGEPINVDLEYWITAATDPLSVGLWLYDSTGTPICSVGNVDEIKDDPLLKDGLYRSRCTIPGDVLTGGRHTLTAGAYRYAPPIKPELIISIPMCLAFDVVEDTRTNPGFANWPGVVRLSFDWKTDMVDELEASLAHER